MDADALARAPPAAERKISNSLITSTFAVFKRETRERHRRYQTNAPKKAALPFWMAGHAELVEAVAVGVKFGEGAGFDGKVFSGFEDVPRLPLPL